MAVAWGGDSTYVASQLCDVVAVQGSSSAFAALRGDGTVVTWGDRGRVCLLCECDVLYVLYVYVMLGGDVWCVVCGMLLLCAECL